MPDPLLEITGLTLHGGPRTDWSDLDLAVDPGTLAEFAGATGGGTSALLGVIAGRRPVGTRVTGRIALGGVDTTHLPAADLGGAVALLADPGRPGARSVAATLAASRGGRAARDALVESLALGAHLTQPLDRCPVAVRARARLAAALLARPRLLLIDQMLAWLPDDQHAAAVETVRAALGEGLTVVWSDHRPFDSLALAQGTNGHALAQGTGRAVQALDPARARLTGDPVGVHAGEVIGVLADDDRDAARLARAWAHDATGRPTDLALAALLRSVPVREAIRRWPLPDDADVLRSLARQLRVRPDALATDHSTGELTQITTELALGADEAALIEPTRGLDAHARTRLAQRLAERSARGHTTVIATGDHAFARRACSRVVVIRDQQVTRAVPARREVRHAG